MHHDPAEYARGLAADALTASRGLVTVTPAQKNAWLRRLAERLRQECDAIVAANADDLNAAEQYRLPAAAVDRLRLDAARIEAIAAGVAQIAMLADPVGEVIDGSVRSSGLRVERVRVPLGVVFFIYESRPNVTVDAAALCVKSGNAVILRGGKESIHSNRALQRVIADTLEDVGLPRLLVQLVETTDRAAVGEFLKLDELIDVTIPRGGRSLIERVAREATMPVIKHFDGICHV
ncbi:MAG: aldehyde dehydrogenase family protein [Planctomycetaceae bacterium]